jgi:hypothetical protein
MRFAVVGGRWPRRAAVVPPDIARRTRAKPLQQWPQSPRFLLPSLGRAVRSTTLPEQVIWAGAPPTGSRDEPRSKAPSVPSPPTHSPGYGAGAKIDRFSSFAFRTHHSVALDVCFFCGTRALPTTCRVRFSPIGESTARLIVLVSATEVYVVSWHYLLPLRCLTQRDWMLCGGSINSASGVLWMTHVTASFAARLLPASEFR